LPFQREPPLAFSPRLTVGNDDIVLVPGIPGEGRTDVWEIFVYVHEEGSSVDP
jgi:hypothetical protein